jgi:hypothetical protein
VVVFGACSSDEGGVAGPGPVGGGGGKDGSAGTGGGSTMRRRRLADPTRPARPSQPKPTVSRPIDVIFLVDTSGSMAPVIDAVVANIDVNFAAIIGASGIDYRVIAIAKHGSAGDFGACFKSPLSLTTCNPVPSAPANNPPSSFTTIRTHPAAPTRIRDHQRLQRAGCARPRTEWLVGVVRRRLQDHRGDDGWHPEGGSLDAAGFDAAPRAESVRHGREARLHRHALVGITENNPRRSPTQRRTASPRTCNSLSVSPGFIYQDPPTGGLRFPLCQYGAFDRFSVIAQGRSRTPRSNASSRCPIRRRRDADPSTIVMKFTPAWSAAVRAGREPGRVRRILFYIEVTIRSAPKRARPLPIRKPRSTPVRLHVVRSDAPSDSRRLPLLQK